MEEQQLYDAHTLEPLESSLEEMHEDKEAAFEVPLSQDSQAHLGDMPLEDSDIRGALQITESDAHLESTQVSGVDSAPVNENLNMKTHPVSSYQDK